MNAQILSVMSYLRTLANATINRRTGKAGILRIYMESKHVRQGGISVTRLAEHLAKWGVDSKDVKTAICQSGCMPGTGKFPYVMLVTPERLSRDKSETKERILRNRDEQRLFYLSLFEDAGLPTEVSELPDFEPETTVN